MQLITPIHIEPNPEKIRYGQKIFTIGSCFSEHIGNQLHANKFETLINPFGTLYNPLAISKILQFVCGKISLSKEHIVERDGQFVHLDLHASLFAPNKEALWQKIEQLKEQCKQFIQTADWIIITLGTAHVYRYKATHEIISNCQKIPAQSFQKECLNIIQMYNELKAAFEALAGINNHIKFIITLSPVRHTKDGIAENMLSKSLLRVLIDELTKAHEQCYYFPSYEIMMDELRDYRFYQEDMIHPNEQAIKHIWNHFITTYFDPKSKEILKRWTAAKQSLQHRAYDVTSKNHQLFLKKLLQTLDELNQQLNLKAEIESVKKQIHE